jgi:hypothetical protein
MAAKNVAHEKLIREIFAKYGAIPYWRIWKNNTGVAFQGKRRISFGLVGSADILGITNTGKFVALEVKTGQAVLSKQQVNFGLMIREMCGIYTVIRKLEDIELLFE